LKTGANCADTLALTLSLDQGEGKKEMITQFLMHPAEKDMLTLFVIHSAQTARKFLINPRRIEFPSP